MPAHQFGNRPWRVYHASECVFKTVTAVNNIENVLTLQGLTTSCR